jgi:small subunit ribosomal protein S15
MNPPRPNTGGGETPLQSLSEVRKMLQNFRAPQAGGGAPSASESATPSFQDLLKNNSSALRPDAGNRSGFDGLDAIRNSLKNVPRKQPPRSSTPFLSPHAHSNIFSKERDGKTAGSMKEDKDSGMMLTRSYSYEDLGKRLGELRPANVAKDGKDWFSLEELQGRIAKLAKLEEQDDQLGGSMSDIRKSIMNFKNAGIGSRVAAPVPMALLGNIGGQSMLDYMRLPPQEELLERYFHPDHMSSEEKMKLELQKVRDEFKMSENDCGSARVQIAQLTVKIKHLSSVLHKKDKHSRKGLQDMVQRRKKYLKYLRRTDWDSYCLVLSKLGLRDVPEYKAPDYKSKSTSKAKSKKSKSKGKRKMKA